MADVPIAVPVGSLTVLPYVTSTGSAFAIPVGSLVFTPLLYERSVIVTIGQATLGFATTSSSIQSPTITKSHSDPLYLGQATSTFTITVENETDLDWTNETIITDVLPTGLTLVSMEGDGWTCVDNVCTRSDTLAAGDTFPEITVTVTVATDITTSLTNVIRLSGFAEYSDPITFAEYIATPVRTPTRWVLHQFSMKPRDEERA